MKKLFFALLLILTSCAWFMSPAQIAQNYYYCLYHNQFTKIKGLAKGPALLQAACFQGQTTEVLGHQLKPETLSRIEVVSIKQNRKNAQVHVKIYLDTQSPLENTLNMQRVAGRWYVFNLENSIINERLYVY